MDWTVYLGTGLMMLAGVACWRGNLRARRVEAAFYAATVNMNKERYSWFEERSTLLGIIDGVRDGRKIIGDKLDESVKQNDALRAQAARQHAALHAIGERVFSTSEYRTPVLTEVLDMARKAIEPQPTYRKPFKPK